MAFLEETTTNCPYCGERLELLIEPLANIELGDVVAMEGQEISEYTEDCQVCCRPIIIRIMLSADGTQLVSALTENE